jgi:hypothetical protein
MNPEDTDAEAGPEAPEGADVSDDEVGSFGQQ